MYLTSGFCVYFHHLWKRLNLTQRQNLWKILDSQVIFFLPYLKDPSFQLLFPPSTANCQSPALSDPPPSPTPLASHLGVPVAQRLPRGLGTWLWLMAMLPSLLLWDGVAGPEGCGGGSRELQGGGHNDKYSINIDSCEGFTLHWLPGLTQVT